MSTASLTTPGRPAAPEPADGASAAGRLRARLAPLFAPAAPRPVTRRGAVLAGLAVMAATAYSLGRVGGPGALDSVWAEDASDFLSGALTQRAVSTIFEPVNGYFLVVPRLLAEFAALFPVAWAPAALSVSAALCTAGMGLLVYLASGALLPHPLARLVLSAGIVAAPVGESYFANVLNSVAPLQFPMLFALFWCASWTPARRRTRVIQVTVVVLCAVSTFLAVIYLPLAVLRLAVRRDRLSLALLAAFLAGAALQVAGLLTGLSSRGDISHPRLDPVWALRSLATWAVPFGLFGPAGVPGAGTTGDGMLFTGSGSGAAYLAAVAGAWLLVAAVVLVAALRWTRPAWLLAGVAGAHAVGLLVMEIMVQGSLALRYVFPTGLLLGTALVALLPPRPDLPRPRALAPLLGLTLVVVAAALANYRSDTLRSRTAPWTAEVAEARARCAGRPDGAQVRVVLDRSRPQWHVRIPCHRLR